MPSTVEQAPVPGFALADGFADLTKGSDISLDDARHPTKREPGEPVKFDAPDQDDAPPEQAAGVDADTPPAEDAPASAEPDAPKDNIADDLQAGMQEEEGKAKAEQEAAEKEAKDKATKDTAAKPEEKPAGTERDGDLKYDAPPTVSRKTRSVITEFQQKAKAARDERDRAVSAHQAEVAELRAKLEAAEKKTAPAASIPEDVTKELTTLRERVRELNVERDPQIEAKFDRHIAGNENKIIELLKSQGYGMRDDGTGKFVENTATISALRKSGVSLSTLLPTLRKLEQADPEKFPEAAEAAETIREHLRDNTRLSRERQSQIDEWKGQYESRTKQREQQTIEAQRQRNESFKSETEKALKADVDALTKDLPFLSPPQAAAQGDSPQVAASKKQAADDYAAAQKAIQEGVAEFQTEGVAPEKLAGVVGKLNASAIKGVMAQRVIIPRLLQQAKIREDRIKQLESEIGKGKAAASISKQHAAIAAAPDGKAEINVSKDASMSDFLTAGAKAMGINVNS